MKKVTDVRGMNFKMISNMVEKNMNTNVLVKLFQPITALEGHRMGKSYLKTHVSAVKII